MTFTIKSRFHPAYSLLGRWMRVRVDDRRRAESLFVVTSGVVALILVLFQFLGWAVFQPRSTVQVLIYLAIQILVACLYATVCLAGRQPSIRVRVSDDGLRIDRREPSTLDPWRLRQDEQTTFIAFNRIDRVSIIDAEVYYRHYARYAATRSFVNRIHPRLLMIELPDGPVILGLAPQDLRALYAKLDEISESALSSSRVA